MHSMHRQRIVSEHQRSLVLQHKVSHRHYPEMCLATAGEPGSTPLFIPLPTSFSEGFGPDQAPTRGTTTWQTLFSTPHLCAGIASLPPDRTGTLGVHRHKQPELYFMLSGTAIVQVEGKRHRLEKGMSMYVPGDAEHGVVGDESPEGEVCRWLYVFPSRFEDVDYRFRSEGAYGDDYVKAKL